ncbi:MAG: hypothetical protein IPL65_17275 [Lewinellaceae bacterium]|nr:hypothetical protein [Lewinellaceae bacterium]
MAHAQLSPPFVPDTLPKLDSLPQILVEAYQHRMVEQSDIMVQSWAERAADATSIRTALEEQYKLAKADSTLQKDSLNVLSTLAKNAKKKEAAVLKDQKKLLRFAETMQASLTLDSASIRQQLPKWHKKLVQLYTLSYPPLPQEESPLANVLGAERISDDVEASQAAIDSTTTMLPALAPGVARKTYAPYDAKQDVMLHPPTPPCHFATERTDSFSGEMVRETTPAELFRHTNPVMKRLLGDQPHILCELAMTQTGSQFALVLTIRIQDANARKTFGGLAKGAAVMLQFIDGSIFTLNTLQADEGIVLPNSNILVYNAKLPLERSVLKKIETAELDKLRINWNAGYEDYEIFLVDALMQQLNCLTHPRS